MHTDYFYGNDAELFGFYEIPKILFMDSRFKSLSIESKLLYGMLWNRMTEDGRIDEEGKMYVLFPIEEVMEMLGCGNKKAVSMMNELEEKVHLIQKRRVGLGQPNRIYVKVLN